MSSSVRFGRFFVFSYLMKCFDYEFSEAAFRYYIRRHVYSNVAAANTEDFSRKKRDIKRETLRS